MMTYSPVEFDVRSYPLLEAFARLCRPEGAEYGVSEAVLKALELKLSFANEREFVDWLTEDIAHQPGSCWPQPHPEKAILAWIRGLASQEADASLHDLAGWTFREVFDLTWDVVSFVLDTPRSTIKRRLGAAGYRDRGFKAGPHPVPEGVLIDVVDYVVYGLFIDSLMPRRLDSTEEQICRFVTVLTSGRRLVDTLAEQIPSGSVEVRHRFNLILAFVERQAGQSLPVEGFKGLVLGPYHQLHMNFAELRANPNTGHVDYLELERQFRRADLDGIERAILIEAAQGWEASHSYLEKLSHQRGWENEFAIRYLQGLNAMRAQSPRKAVAIFEQIRKSSLCLPAHRRHIEELIRHAKNHWHDGASLTLPNRILPY